MIKKHKRLPKQLIEVLKKLKNLYMDYDIDTLIPAMILLKFKDSPYNLDNHFQFEPLFKTIRPKRTVLKCARQVGKSQNVCGSNIIKSWLNRYYNTLFVLPRYEQSARLSTDIVQKFLVDSPFIPLFQNPKSICSVAQKSYLNESIQYFSYAFLSCDRLRGISGISEIIADEAQDLNWEHIPVITEVTSAVIDYGFLNFTGTPKSMENTLTLLWDSSSQGEWTTKCFHCNKWNIGSAKEDLLKMIGKNTCVCAKCGKPLDPSTGNYVHAFPDRQGDYAGYHISQVTHPLHYKYSHKWAELLMKQRAYPKIKFYNEVLGEEQDTADMLLSQTDLVKACSTSKDFTNSPQISIERSKKLSHIIVGIDWGGGGADGTSFTAITVGGVVPGTDIIEIVYLKKLSKFLDPSKIIKEVLIVIGMFNPMFVAHDYGGAGAIQETLLVQAGYPLDKIIPYSYIFAPKKPIISFEQNTQGYRSSYSLDKARSLTALCTTIKAGYIKFPTWDSCSKTQIDGQDTSVLLDLINLYIERMETLRGGDVMLVKRKAGKSDDISHAINYVCSTIWYIRQKYPDCANSLNSHLSDNEVSDIVSSEGMDLRSTKLLDNYHN